MEYLPLFPPAIRDQALRLLAQLLDHDRSIENNHRRSKYHFDLLIFCRRASDSVSLIITPISKDSF